VGLEPTTQISPSY